MPASVTEEGEQNPDHHQPAAEVKRVLKRLRYTV
jgi:hypothetical protein